MAVNTCCFEIDKKRKGKHKQMQQMWKVLKQQPNEVIVSNYGSEGNWLRGVSKKCSGKLKPCANGFHASGTPGEAWQTVNGTVIALVEGHGEFSEERQKVCYREMKVVKAWKVTKENIIDAFVDFLSSPAGKKLKGSDVYMTLLLRAQPPSQTELRMLPSSPLTDCIEKLRSDKALPTSLLEGLIKYLLNTSVDGYPLFGEKIINDMVLNIVASDANRIR